MSECTAMPACTDACHGSIVVHCIDDNCGPVVCSERRAASMQVA
jgi:hypothetical protein